MARGSPAGVGIGGKVPAHSSLIRPPRHCSSWTHSHPSRPRTCWQQPRNWSDMSAHSVRICDQRTASSQQMTPARSGRDRRAAHPHSRATMGAGSSGDLRHPTELCPLGGTHRKRRPGRRRLAEAESGSCTSDAARSPAAAHHSTPRHPSAAGLGRCYGTDHGRVLGLHRTDSAWHRSSHRIPRTPERRRRTQRKSPRSKMASPCAVRSNSSHRTVAGRDQPARCGLRSSRRGRLGCLHCASAEGRRPVQRLRGALHHSADRGSRRCSDGGATSCTAY